ncbi:hypothetical protein Salat_1473900 [Sesamum alatum]|uniref:Reverse transcriptase zinc-binding domain-containing protein n=1 Tax=Sesamum alatum TaxID=300844 RepID=A0AAE1YBI7_9LAMI|nr:hypothetical protein Salat_1473900 [Sesamum alatum]
MGFLLEGRVVDHVRLFAWKACKNAILTGENFVHCGISHALYCLVCGMDREDVGHALFFYSLAKLIWAVSELPWGVVKEWNSGCEDWMRGAHVRLELGQFAWFLIVCWILWNNRNQILMEGSMEDARNLLANSKKYLAAYAYAITKPAI